MGLSGLPARREVEPRFSRALSPGGSHVSSSPALPDGGRGRGAESHKAPWSGVRGCPAETGRERSSGPGRPVSGGATPPPCLRDSPGGGGRKASPAERRFPAPCLPPSPLYLPCRLGREGIPYPTLGRVGGGQAAGASRAATVGRPHTAHQARAPSTSEASGRPSRRALIPSSPLARLRAFSGLWK